MWKVRGDRHQLDAKGSRCLSERRGGWVRREREHTEKWEGLEHSICRMTNRNTEMLADLHSAVYEPHMEQEARVKVASTIDGGDKWGVGAR